jgi:hypothetical protein
MTKLFRLFLITSLALFCCLGVLCRHPHKSTSSSLEYTWKLDNKGDTLYWEGCIGGWSYTNPNAEIGTLERR